MSEIAKCPNRIWPDLMLAQSPYIILDKSTKTSVVISHNEHGVPSYRLPEAGEITEQHLKYDGNKTPSFNTTLINGTKRVIIFLDSRKNDSVRKKGKLLGIAAP